MGRPDTEEFSSRDRTVPSSRLAGEVTPESQATEGYALPR